MIVNSETTPSPADRQSSLQAVIALSRQMLDLATQGNWQQFAELEKGRRSDMLACFEQPVNVSEAPLVRHSIEQLMQLNDQLTEILQKAREDSSRQFQALKRGRQAVGAYAS